MKGLTGFGFTTGSSSSGGGNNSSNSRNRGKGKAAKTSPPNKLGAKKGAAAASKKKKEYGTCPVCGFSKPLPLEQHAARCEGIAQMASTSKAKKFNALSDVERLGLRVFEDFLSKEEEEELVTRVHADPQVWRNMQWNGQHLGKTWGVKAITEGGAKRRRIVAGAVAMPSYLDFVIERIHKLLQRPELAFPGWAVNEANAIWYQAAKGDYLSAHCDDRHLHKGPIVNLSLLGRAAMTYRREGNEAVAHKQELPPRCLQLIKDKIRYDYTHEILGEDIDDQRISITFRYSPL